MIISEQCPTPEDRIPDPGFREFRGGSCLVHQKLGNRTKNCKVGMKGEKKIESPKKIFQAYLLLIYIYILSGRITKVLGGA